MRRTNARPRRLHYTHGQLINWFYALHLARLNSWSRKTEGRVNSVLWMIYKFNTTEWGQSPVLPSIIDILPCSSSSCYTNKEQATVQFPLFLSKTCVAGFILDRCMWVLACLLAKPLPPCRSENNFSVVIYYTKREVFLKRELLARPRPRWLITCIITNAILIRDWFGCTCLPMYDQTHTSNT